MSDFGDDNYDMGGAYVTHLRGSLAGFLDFALRSLANLTMRYQ